MSTKLELIHGLGKISCRVTPAEPRPGQGPSLARLRIETSRQRPAEIGGGTVSWTLLADPGGDSDHIPALNALIEVVAELLPGQATFCAAGKHAFLERDAERAARVAADKRLQATLTGRTSQVFGRALVRVERDGSVWLQDPAKQDRGLGFRFESLADLWRTHPELRPVEWGVDDQGPYMLVEAFAMTPDGAP